MCKLESMVPKIHGFSLFCLLCIRVAPSQEVAQVHGRTPGSGAVICRVLEAYQESGGKQEIKREFDRPHSGFCLVASRFVLYVSSALAIIQTKPNKETCLLAESCLK